jgi:hypothetical protein
MTISREAKKEATWASKGAQVAFRSPALITMARRTRGHDYMTWTEYKAYTLGRATITHREALEAWTRTGRTNHRALVRR